MKQTVPVPDHELLQRIGRGSYGEVWLARNVMGQGRAVKIIRRDAFDSSRPFEREFAAIRRYEPVSRQADGLVNVLHVGRNDEEGLFYYVMELADALPRKNADDPPEADAALEADAAPPAYAPRTLSGELSARGSLPPAECLEIALSLTQALGTLHRAGLVHRDIKPSNIIFVHGQAKLADIGLVGELGESRSFVGTEGYIPPEGPGQPSADFYALGRVLYEALTGQEPRRFPLLPAAAMHALAAPEAQELMEVLLRSGESDAARRYQSAEEMMADLALIRSGRSVRRMHVMEQRWRVVQRAGTVLLVLLALAGGGWLLARNQAQRERRLRESSDSALALSQRTSARLAAYAGDPSARGRWLEAIAASVSGSGGGDGSAGDNTDLRSEAIAALLRPGLRELRRIPVPLVLPAPAIAADFTRCAVPQPDGSLLLHDMTTGAECARFPRAQCHGLWSLAIDESGQRVAVRGRDDVLRLFEAGRDSPLLELPETTDFQFLPDGKTLAVRRPDGALVLYDSTSGRERQHFVWQGGSLPGALFASPDGRWLAAVEAESAHICHADSGAAGPKFSTGTLPHVLAGEPAVVNFSAAAWNGRSGHFLTGMGDGRCVSWPLAAPDRPRVITVHGGHVTAIAATADGTLLATSCWDRTTRLSSIATGQRLLTLHGWGNCVAFAPDGLALARHDVVARSLVIHALDLTPAARTFRLEAAPPLTGSPTGVDGIAFSPDGQWIAAGHRQGVRLMLRDGTRLTDLPWDQCSSVAFSDDGSTLWAASNKGLLCCRLERTGAAAWSAGPMQRMAPGLCLRMSAEGARVAAAVNYTPVVRRVEGAFQIFGPAANWHAAAMSPDAKWAAFGRSDGGAAVWSADAAQTRTDLPAPGEWTQVTFSRDSRALFVGSAAGVTRHRAGTWEAEWTVPLSSRGGIARMAVSADGAILAASLGAGSVTLLAASTGLPLAELPAPDDLEITSLAFSPRGETLAAGLAGPLVHLWDLRRLRHELAAMNLDWPAPPLPPAPVPAEKPQISVQE